MCRRGERSRAKGGGPWLTITLPGPDYFDEEAKCYSRLFEFCQVTFCHSRQWGRMTLARF